MNSQQKGLRLHQGYGYGHKLWLNVYELVEILQAGSFFTVEGTDTVQNPVYI